MKKLLLGIGYGILAILGLLFLWGWGFSCAMGMISTPTCTFYLPLGLFLWLAGIITAIISFFTKRKLFVILAFALLLSPAASAIIAAQQERLIEHGFNLQVMTKDCESLGNDEQYGKYGKSDFRCFRFRPRTRSEIDECGRGCLAEWVDFVQDRCCFH